VLAAEALSKIDDERTIEPLIAALKDKDPDVVWRAAAALGDKGDNRAIEPLIATLKHKDLAVQHFVAAALVKIGEPAVEPLITVLKNTNSDAFRVKAITMLDKIGDKRAVEPLITVLKVADADTTRTAAAIALGKIGDKRAVRPLITLLKDKDPEVQKLAAEALVKIGSPAVKPLITRLKDKSDVMRVIVITVLGKIGDNRAVLPLIVAFKDESPSVQKSAADALVKIGAPAVKPLVALLKDKDPEVQKSAAEALERIGAPAVKPLIAALKHESEAVRLASATALGRIGDKRAVHSLVEALTDWNVRRSAAMALDSLGWEPVIPSDRIHYLYAKGQKNELLNEWELTNKILLNDIRYGTQKSIQNAVYAFIDLGGNNIIPELMKILDSNGNVFIAQVYLDSGHQRLMEAAIKWADRHGSHMVPESANDGNGEGRRGDRTSQ